MFNIGRLSLCSAVLLALVFASAAPQGSFVGLCKSAHADDDIEVPAVQVPPDIVPEPPIRRFDKFLDDEVRFKVDDFRARYDLNQGQQNRMTLACRVDARRFADAAAERKARESGWVHGERLFGPSSFLVKSLPKILTKDQSTKYQADVDDRVRLRHRSNIEGVIREIERYVVLDIPTQERLVDLLLDEIKPPKVEHRLDALLVRYQIAQLPESTLQPLFDEDQWPKVRKTLNEYHKHRGVLRDNGLIGRRSWTDDIDIPKSPPEK